MIAHFASEKALLLCADVRVRRLLGVFQTVLSECGLSVFLTQFFVIFRIAAELDNFRKGLFFGVLSSPAEWEVDHFHRRAHVYRL